MSMVTYPLNNIEYTAEDAELFHSTRTSGVYATNSFDYSATGADNTIIIRTGIAWIKNSEFSGKVVAQKESISLDMGLPDSVYPRIDAIVIQFDSNRNETNIVAKTGVASSMPVAPTVVRTESVYELHLYHVLREAGSLYITPSNITDLRLNSSYCGLMADSVTNIDTTAIERQVADLIESLQNEISNVIDGSAYLLRNGSTNMTGNLPMDGHKVTGLGTPTADGDAVPKKYIDNLSANDVGAVPTTRKVNGKALSANITLSASDVGALDLGWITDSERQISTGDNLDNYIVPDAYRCMTAAIAKSLVNGPNYRGAGFRLIVAATSHNSVGVMQIAVFNALTPKVEVRVQNHSGEWGAWDTLLGSGNVETASADNSYHTAYFTRIGRFVSCTLLPKTANTTAIYQEDITIPSSNFYPAENTSFNIYSSLSGGGNAEVKAYTNGTLRVMLGTGVSVEDSSKTYCWITA